MQDVPGMPRQTREKATAELLRLTAAWQIIESTLPPKPDTKKPATAKTPTPKPATVDLHQQAQTLAEVWEQMASLSPFSESRLTAILALVLILVILAIIASLTG
jgi:hypothetical protein